MILFADERKKQGKTVVLKSGQKFSTIKESLAFIKEKLSIDLAWLERALVALYHLQEPDERACSDTVYHNKRGFSAYDAPRGSILARLILQGQHLDGISRREAFGIVQKYRRQLLTLAAQSISYV